MKNKLPDVQPDGTMPDSFFQKLTPEQEADFIEYATIKDPPDMALWDIYHPVCRKVWAARGITPPAPMPAPPPTVKAPTNYLDRLGGVNRLKVGDHGRGVMPYAEVCMHMGVAGKEMAFKVVGERAVQLIDPNTGENFSAPILPGEAGIFRDNEGLYYYG